MRHNGREWVFNSADLVSPQNTESPRAAFVAFFGDIGHEVTEVKSGYRVTLTYNLYFGDDKSSIRSPTMLPIDDTEAKINKLFKALLNNPKFFPDGGFVGFSLPHLYPIAIGSRRNTNLLKIGKNFKVKDAAIKRVCGSLSLKISLKTVYNSNIDWVYCLLDDNAVPGDQRIEGDILLNLHQHSDQFGSLGHFSH